MAKTAAAPKPRRSGALGAYFVRNQILEGAARVFAARGAADTSVEHLLEESGVSRRTFYRFFANKEEVLEGLFEVATRLFVQAFHDAVASAPTPELRIAAAVDAYLRFSQESPGLMAVLQGEAQRPGSPLAARRLHVVAELAALLGQQSEQALGMKVEPLVLAGIVHALEGITRTVLAEGAPSETTLGRARAAMLRVVSAVLAGQGPLVAPLPRAHRD